MRMRNVHGRYLFSIRRILSEIDTQIVGLPLHNYITTVYRVFYSRKNKIYNGIMHIKVALHSLGIQLRFLNNNSVRHVT